MENKQINSYKMACIIARFLDEKKAEDVSILNISNVSSFADYFVLCSAQTSTQVKSLTENLAEKLKNTFNKFSVGKEQDLKNRWNLLDYGDIIVHILHKDDRDAYAIEKFWNHALRVSQADWMKESEEYSEYNKG